MQIKQYSVFQRFVRSSEMVFSQSAIGVKYSRSKETCRNWGDALNAYMIPRITGKQVVHYSEYLNLGIFPTLAAIGSVLDNNQVKNLHVWGSGLKSEEAKIPRAPTRVWAVRGRLTQKRLFEAGIKCPDVFGDPALLMPRFYQPKNVIKKYSVGVIPHYIDKEDAAKLVPASSEFKILDIESDIETFVDELLSCEIVVSSSLHGLIAADAYGVPRVWMKVSNRIKGEGFKFRDYFSTTDTQSVPQLVLTESTWRQSLLPFVIRPQRLAETDRLFSNFPAFAL